MCIRDRDTYDGWIKLAEQEAIRLWNKDHMDKKADTIDGAWNRCV